MLALVLTALALAAPPGGLYGTVRKGPTMPVCRVGTPCTAPAVGEVLVFTRAGAAAVRTTTAAGGRYRVTLRPGTYGVRVAGPMRIGRGLEPRTVMVPRGRYARADFMLDTGIR